MMPVHLMMIGVMVMANTLTKKQIKKINSFKPNQINWSKLSDEELSLYTGMAIKLEIRQEAIHQKRLRRPVLDLRSTIPNKQTIISNKQQEELNKQRRVNRLIPQQTKNIQKYTNFTPIKGDVDKNKNINHIFLDVFNEDRIVELNKKMIKQALNTATAIKLELKPEDLSTENASYQKNRVLNNHKQRLEIAKKNSEKFKSLNTEQRLAVLTKNLKSEAHQQADSNNSSEGANLFNIMTYNDLYNLLIDAYNNRDGSLADLWDIIKAEASYDTDNEASIVLEVVIYYKNKGYTPKQLLNTIGKQAVETYLMYGDDSYTPDDFGFEDITDARKKIIGV